MLFLAVPGFCMSFGVALNSAITQFAYAFAKFFMGLGVIIGGAVGARIWCELLIVLIKIHENIKKFSDKQVSNHLFGGAQNGE